MKALMPNLSESLLLRALRRQPVPRTPIWLMRQAGRYLPEYRATRAQSGSFLNLCKSKELACEVTLQPLQRFALDAAILFSDILTIPDAMGLGLTFLEGEGPRFKHPIRDPAAIDALPIPNPSEELAYVMDAVSLIRQELPSHIPLIGFAGSPWTLACYMIEGESSREFKRALGMMYLEPQAMQQLLQKLTLAVIDYLSAQVMAGASVLMVFDTWGGILSTHHYQHYSLAYMHTIVEALQIKHPEVPVILYTKGGGQWLPALANTGCQAVGLDWTCDLAAARKQVGERVALQGNLDPAVLLSSAACIRAEVKRILAEFGSGPGLVFNLGHGITPDVPVEHVKVLVDAVHDLSPGYAQGEL